MFALRIARPIGLGLLCTCAIAAAELPARSQDYRPNPLEVCPVEPLPLSAEPLATPARAPAQVPAQWTLERSQPENVLNDLDRLATAELAAGNPEAAFSTWFRELCGWQAIGPVAEVNALGRVGDIAWQENREREVQDIVDRLGSIQVAAGLGSIELVPEEDDLDDVSIAPDPQLETALAEAYQQLREPQLALRLYEKQLADARDRGDANAEVLLLRTVADLHLAWFDYTQAALAYEQLLLLAQARGDNFSLIDYLRALADIYERNSQPKNGIRTRSQLIDTYRDRAQLDLLPPLLLELGNDYRDLDRPNDASNAYSEAFELAWPRQQYAAASDALNALADLYAKNDRPDSALQIYAELIKVKQQSLDFYGLMQTYERMAELHRRREDYINALNAYERGLRVARTLQFNEAHFVEQIECVTQELEAQSAS
ncbi:hypothetical protein KR51_00036280 [Rubidibacter lacunae KORDI 51-2]|uniref:Uncharacterized protein n=1 Tax=Rubidibacter lacunae KORDI 51-2 TaxID=582515 RepID=U5DF38_9CHRO|nr:tetratricopeptide repeat protein [Rubidibacter lacunae]ERN39927.1 hypothetical protein KR51_00036280 [Rubidibacter lacunae KORDI 51-2]